LISQLLQLIESLLLSNAMSGYTSDYKV